MARDQSRRRSGARSTGSEAFLGSAAEARCRHQVVWLQTSKRLVRIPEVFVILPPGLPCIREVHRLEAADPLLA